MQLYQKYVLFRFVVFYKEFLKILQTSVSQKTFQQLLLAAADYGLRYTSFEWKSNRTEMAKSTCYFRSRIYCNIQKNLAKQFTLHSAEACSEPFQMSKQGGLPLWRQLFSQKMFDKVLDTLFPNEPQKQSIYMRQRHTTWQL